MFAYIQRNSELLGLFFWGIYRENSREMVIKVQNTRPRAEVSVLALVMRCHACDPTVYQVTDMAARLHKPLMEEGCAFVSVLQAGGIFRTAH